MRPAVCSAILSGCCLAALVSSCAAHSQTTHSLVLGSSMGQICSPGDRSGYAHFAIDTPTNTGSHPVKVESISSADSHIQVTKWSIVHSDSELSTGPGSSVFVNRMQIIPAHETALLEVVVHSTSSVEATTPNLVVKYKDQTSGDIGKLNTKYSLEISAHGSDCSN